MKPTKKQSAKKQPSNKSSKITLSGEQKKYINENWDKVALKELTRKVFNDDTINGNHAEARAIKAYIVSEFGEEAKPTTTEYKAKFGDMKLTEDQQLYIKNNFQSSTIEEMVSILFSEEYLSWEDKTKIYLRKPYLLIYEYTKTLDPCYIKVEDQIVDEKEYKPPTSYARLVPRVNEYVRKGKIEKNEKYLLLENLSAQEKKYLDALLGYMSVYQYTYQMNVYKKKVDRELAESTFVRFCWGKPDLEEEEVTRYISLVEAIVESAKIQRTIERFEREMETALDGTADGKRLSMTIVEAIDSQRNFLKESKKRQEDIMKQLITSRSEKLKKRIEKSASFVNLFEAWRQEESRKPMILLAQHKQKEVKREVGRLADMDALMVEVYGLDESTIDI